MTAPSKSTDLTDFRIIEWANGWPSNPITGDGVYMAMEIVRHRAATSAEAIAGQIALSAPGLDMEQLVDDIRGAKWHLVAAAIVAATNSAAVKDSQIIYALRREVDELKSLAAQVARVVGESSRDLGDLAASIAVFTQESSEAAHHPDHASMTDGEVASMVAKMRPCTSSGLPMPASTAAVAESPCSLTLTDADDASLLNWHVETRLTDDVALFGSRWERNGDPMTIHDARGVFARWCAVPGMYVRLIRTWHGARSQQVVATHDPASEAAKSEVKHGAGQANDWIVSMRLPDGPGGRYDEFESADLAIAYYVRQCSPVLGLHVKLIRVSHSGEERLSQVVATHEPGQVAPRLEQVILDLASRFVSSGE